jgi:hypothetical protein
LRGGALADVIFKELTKVFKNRQRGENSPNLVTLLVDYGSQRLRQKCADKTLSKKVGQKKCFCFSRADANAHAYAHGT